MHKNITKTNNRIISIIATIFIIIVTLFLLVEKVHLMEHNQCNEEQCPICNVAYIVNKELKNVSLGNVNIELALLALLIFAVLKCAIDIVYVKELSLIKCKVRLND